jgi:hypothetical protein
MFAKIFTQIFDSSIAEDYQTRHVFEDLLKLCDINGVVDITLKNSLRSLFISKRTPNESKRVQIGYDDLA